MKLTEKDYIFALKRKTLLISISISILIYCVGYLIYFFSGYSFGVDRMLAKYNSRTPFYSSFLTVGTNIFVLFAFIKLSLFKFPEVVNIRRISSSFLSLFIFSIPILLIDSYFFTVVSERFIAKQLLGNFIILNIIYLSLSYHAWNILTSKKFFNIFFSIVLVFITSIISFEREPLFFIFFAITLRVINNSSIKKSIFSLSLIISLFILLTFSSKQVSNIVSSKSDTPIEYLQNFSDKFGNPIYFLSGQVSQKVMLENLYLFDSFRPKYNPKRIFYPVQIERLISKKGHQAKTNGNIAAETYADKKIRNKFSGIGFSLFLDFYITFGISSLIILPVFIYFIFQTIINSHYNYLLIVPSQVWFFKALRSDFWPSVIPYFSLVIIFLFLMPRITKKRIFKNNF